MPRFISRCNLNEFIDNDVRIVSFSCQSRLKNLVVFSKNVLTCYNVTRYTRYTMKKKTNKSSLVVKPRKMSLAQASKRTRLVINCTEEEKILIKTIAASEGVTAAELVLNQFRSKSDEPQLLANLKKSIQQSKEGKVRSRGSFAKYVE